MAYGVTSSGFVLKPLDQIKSEIEDAFKTVFGASINLTPQSVFGQLVGILSDRELDLWELAQATYNAAYPDSAEGTSLDNVAAITGLARLQPTKSQVTVTASGTPGTVIAAGKVISVATAGTRFVTKASATIGGGGTVSIDCESQDFGPKVANAGTLTVIETPVAGWTSVTNPLDATLGRDLETDAAFRLRREEALRVSGNASVEALRSDVLAVSNVTEARVFENPTSVTDSDGLPPHSVEVVVAGGLDADIEEAIWESKAAGIETYGSTSGTVTDSQGQTHTIKFSRPVEEDVWIIATVSTDSNFPGDGVARIKQALVDYANANLGLGNKVVDSALYPPIFSVPGVVDLVSLLIGLTNPPTGSSNIAITSRQLAKFDTSRITVNLV